MESKSREIILTKSMHIEKDSITLESDIIKAKATVAINLIVKKPSIYYMI